MKTIPTACPRDCLDCCSILASVDERGHLIKVQGDPKHPITRGFLCIKGDSYKDLIYHPQRISYPLKKVKGEWRQISWVEALSFLKEKIMETISKYGSERILHLHYSGSESLTKGITKRFFALLGATGVNGSLCMSGGLAAQLYDFGGLLQSEPQQIYNAKGCVVWGRNIPSTNLHLMPFLKKANDQGMELFLINPLMTGLEGMATKIIRPRPGTDAPLALGACYHLIQTQGIDLNFINKYTTGIKEFSASIKEYPPNKVAEMVGIGEKEILELASFYEERKPVTTLLGYGLQRYRGGGNTIRAIDALAALTGNIGEKGASVSYCSDTFWSLNQHLQGEAQYKRSFDLTNLAEEIIHGDPPINLFFINAANPMVNVPMTLKMKEALKKIETIVVSDMFMSDTAKEAHLFLPVTSFFEEEGVRVSSWSSWIYYCPQVIAPIGEARSDEDVILSLAKDLGISDFPWKNRGELLEWAVKPLPVGLDEIRQGHMRHPKAPSIAWKEKKFKTPSGKFEFYSKKALADGQAPMATFIPPFEDNYPLHFISPHSAYRIHSQFQQVEKIMRKNPFPKAYLHEKTSAEYGIEEGDLVELYNDQGQIRAIAAFSKEMGQNIVSLESGWSFHSGGCANVLVKPYKTEMGHSAALYDVKVGIRKKNDRESSY